MTPLLIDVPLRWSDLDAYGHVNNATFLTLLEEARITALNTWFGDHEMLRTGILVVRHEIEYTAQLSYESGPVVVELWISDITASTFDVAYVVRDRSGSGRRYAVADTTLVAFDTTAQRPRRLTVQERTALTPYLGERAPLRRRTS